MLPLSIQLTLSLVLSLTMVLAFLTVAWVLRRWRQQAACDAQRMFEQLDLIRAEVMLLADRVQGMEVQAQAAPLAPRSAPIEFKAPPAATSAAAPRGYEIAARLARGGATCEELISSCGLSRHEAELLMRLNKADATRAKVATPAAQPKASEKPRARLAVAG